MRSHIITSKEAPEYRISRASFELMAESVNCTFLYLPSFKNEIGKNLIGVCAKTDICLCVNYSGVTPSEITDLFSLGILNAHLGDLPSYRGNAIGAWAINNGEEKAGLCIHKMAGGELDSAYILCKRYHDNNGNFRIGHLYAWMDIEIPAQFIKAVNLLQDGSHVLEVKDKNPDLAFRTFLRQ